MHFELGDDLGHVAPDILVYRHELGWVKLPICFDQKADLQLLLIILFRLAISGQLEEAQVADEASCRVIHLAIQVPLSLSILSDSSLVWSLSLARLLACVP